MTASPDRKRLLSLSWLPEGFAARVRDESGWAPDDVDAALAEYARFLWLAATLPEGAVPSRAVDAVWHLHLLHTRNYWDTLCASVLGHPLHHDPGGSGAPVPEGGFEAAYARTLDAYRSAFGGEAPPRFWPPADTARTNP